MADVGTKIARLLELAALHGAKAPEVEQYRIEIEALSAKKLDGELAKAEKAEADRLERIEAERVARADKASEAAGLERCRVLQRVVHSGQPHEPGAVLWLKPEAILARPEHLEPI